MQDYRKILGSNIRTARSQFQISQEKLGMEIGIDRTYISGIERGIRNPSLDVICRIAMVLKTTPSALLEKLG
ncbi:MAG: helix-turn-helix transcriptional regulator [Rhodobacteraceae bacterium]|nr:helix-turn-helix transcriptional regulator [Paracoccaceae bacterium]